MKLPGVALLREQQAVKAFERQEPAFRDLVFYSEGAGDWPHVGPVLSRALRDHGLKISYLTSDAADPAFAIDDPRLRVFNVGSGTARTVLFARIQCSRFVMTLPDLGNLWLKRSVHPVHYVYLFHSMNSTHTSYRPRAFDNFDTILCVGPHHVAEIRATEELHGLPAKELVHHGSVKLDSVLEERAGVTDRAPAADGRHRVLVAPTWGDSSLIEHPVGQQVIGALLNAGYDTILRLHPMTSRRRPAFTSRVLQAFEGHQSFRLETDMSRTESWLQSEVMISDWSGAAIEYALATQKPVIFIDTPQKVMNPDWQEIGLPAFEDVVRRRLGIVVNPADADALADVVDSVIQERSGRSRQLQPQELVFNVGTSARAAATALASMSAAGR